MVPEKSEKSEKLTSGDSVENPGVTQLHEAVENGHSYKLTPLKLVLFDSLMCDLPSLTFNLVNLFLKIFQSIYNTDVTTNRFLKTSVTTKIRNISRIYYYNILCLSLDLWQCLLITLTKVSKFVSSLCRKIRLHTYINKMTQP